ncbi:hypothetical protein F2Q68_00036117 [Brassica cretica]|uniref:acid phosphatase n=1 Tax=Brassica cretica TaxID=69181 RepID=A0A8S9GUB7_BRACR|nr:hypothetical protein F2Q68_00036117 [Brassica cretica]
MFSVRLIFLILCIFFNGSLSKLERLDHPVTKSDGSLNILVVGDWGRQGGFNQSLVAHQMGIVGEQLDIDFVISVGDNFYDDGLKGDTDPAFEASFSHIYTHPSLQKQWYSVLGNHDYRGNVSAQLSHVLTQKDWRWFCRRSFVLCSGMVEFFFVDTNPFVEKYFTDPEDHTYDWSNVLPRDKYISNLLHDLDLEMKKSRATWKFVVGHHGIKTAGQHGVTQELVDQLLPILEENKVDLYINGHDHCLQHIGSDSEIQFLTSGGGSKAWRGVILPWDPKELKLYYDGQGFMSLHITHSQTKFIYYDISSNVLHQSTLSKKSKTFVYDSSKLPQSSRSLHRWRCKIGSQLETQWKSISGLRLSCGRIRRFKSEARVCARFLWSAGEVEDGRINSGSAIFGGRSESHFSGSGSDLVQSVHRLCLASLPLLVWCVL